VAYKFGARSQRSADQRALLFVLGIDESADDDPARGVRMALALIETLDGIARDIQPPMRLSVGVQRGLALVTRLGRAGTVEFELLGSSALIARRLAQEALPGEVRAGGGAYRVARNEWRFQELDSIVLPAREHERESRAKVYRLLGARRRQDV